MNVVLTVIVLLFSLRTTGSVSHHFGILSSYSLYGNELQQAQLLYKYVDPRYNASTYYREQAYCHTTTNASCSLALYHKYRPDLRIWRPVYDSRYFAKIGRVEADCRYTIDVLMQRHHISHFVEDSWFTIEYQFAISQGNCENWDLEQSLRTGGSTFDIFATHEYFTTACSAIDQRDGSYVVYCRYMFDFQYYAPSEMEHFRCINLTAVLAYEHYDAYSEVLPDYRVSKTKSEELPSMRNRFWSSRRVIADSKPFCFGAHQVHSHIQKLDARGNDSLSNNHILSELFGKENSRRRNTTWYTAKWTISANRRIVNGTSSTNRTMNTFFDDKYKSAYENKKLALGAEMVKIAETLLSAARHKERDSFPKTIPLTATQAPTTTSFKYEHEILYLNSRSYPRRYTVLTSKELRETLSVKDLANDFDLFFLGDSHVRFLYEATTALVFGNTAASTTVTASEAKQKGDVIQHQNMFYYGSGDAEQSTDSAKNVARICQVSTKRRKKLIIHTGWNDLGISSLRRYVDSPLGGTSLVESILRIVSGTVPCAGLTQVIWITTVPHSICFNDFKTSCNDNRSYRNNANIAAANEFVLQRLIRGQSAPGIKLTIIDAFSMIKSRLGFYEDAEVDCENFYVCRVGNSIVYTPGGLAVLDSLIHATSSFGNQDDLKYSTFKDWDPDEIIAEFSKEAKMLDDEELRKKKEKKGGNI